MDRDGVITGVLALLFAVFYVGANIDPVDHMTKLPVGLVNADRGAVVGDKQVNLGAQITESIKKSTASGAKIDWKVMDERDVKEELGEGKLYGALLVPADFTSSTTALTGAATTATPARPTLTVLTNQSPGSVGSSLARAATTQAAENASLQMGRELTLQSGTGQAKLPAAARVLLADPAAVAVKDGHPLDSHSGLGLTAFYYALVLVVCGMLSANVISGQVDHALGYTHNDMGPLGHDGGRTVRLRRTGVVRPQGTAPHPGGDDAREDRRPGVTAGHPRRAITRSGPGVCRPAGDDRRAHHHGSATAPGEGRPPGTKGGAPLRPRGGAHTPAPPRKSPPLK
ncbi:YhgE/Pip domain-containing protein [Streptomyces viridochromogenes]|uniref:YhgE/Pip domain-containing protein n=1 Tax=Streptomyces viridochromogenes TaxID=1938 RepID=UPI000ADB848B|nr:DUF3533 domain-containing protein [Streptomyces viridochromogenes]